MGNICCCVSDSSHEGIRAADTPSLPPATEPPPAPPPRGSQALGEAAKKMMQEGEQTGDGSLQVGDMIWYVGQSMPLESGITIQYGMQGVVARLFEEEDKDRVGIQFEETGKTTLSCKINEVTREKPDDVLAGGWRVGDAAFYRGSPNDFGNGLRLRYGCKGKVAGPADDDTMVGVRFDGIPSPIGVAVADISREELPAEFAGSLKVDDQAWYTGGTQSYPTGEKLETGAQGVVLGPNPQDEGDVLMSFPHLGQFVSIEADMLSKEEPKD